MLTTKPAVRINVVKVCMAGLALRAEVAVDIGTVDAFVAARAPASAAIDARGIGDAVGETGVVFTGNDRAVAFRNGVFKMAFQAEIGVALNEHFLVHRTMRAVARDAAFAHGVVFENEWTLLRRVAFGAGFILALESACAATLDRIALVRIMAFRAAHFSGEHRMAVRQAELATLVEMALETSFGGFPRIYDGAFAAAGLHVFTAGTVAAFTAQALGVFTLNDESGVRCGVETLDRFLVALGAFF